VTTVAEQPDGERHPIAAVALLAERMRRDLYDFVRRANGPVTRDEAAAHTGISRRLAAFHLDKLVHGGLLRAHTDRPAAGVGRRPKVYEPEPVELAVSVPARQYDLLAELLVDAVSATDHPATEPGPATEAGSPPGAVVAASARDQARQRGRRAGVDARAQLRPGRLGPERALTLAQSVLETCGYEPVRQAPRELVLRNCPFDRLAERSRDLVCGINHAFCSGLVEGLDAAGVDARLEPAPGLCCVQLHGR
jgi:predicted ArsR family transcriptional regulator